MRNRNKKWQRRRLGALKSGGKNSQTASAKRLQKDPEIAGPMPQIIARIPKRGMTRKKWDTRITAHLVAIWRDRMPLADLKIASPNEPFWVDRMSPAALRVLDAIILRQVTTLGWRIGLSWLVQFRLSEWELVPEGLKLFKRYHNGVERAARIFQRLEKPPLDDPELYRSKIETVKELRVLLSKMRDAYQDRLYDPPDDLEPVLVAHFGKAVAKQSKSMPFLAANRASWLAFFNEQPTVLRSQLNGVRLRPASLFYSWLAWCKGMDEEWIRQNISHLGSSPRKPIHNAKL